MRLHNFSSKDITRHDIHPPESAADDTDSFPNIS